MVFVPSVLLLTLAADCAIYAIRPDLPVWTPRALLLDAGNMIFLLLLIGSVFWGSIHHYRQWVGAGGDEEDEEEARTPLVPGDEPKRRRWREDEDEDTTDQEADAALAVAFDLLWFIDLALLVIALCLRLAGLSAEFDCVLLILLGYGVAILLWILWTRAMLRPRRCICGGHR